MVHDNRYELPHDRLRWSSGWFWVEADWPACGVCGVVVSSEDLKTKAKRALKAILAKCTHLQVTTTATSHPPACLPACHAAVAPTDSDPSWMTLPHLPRH